MLSTLSGDSQATGLYLCHLNKVSSNLEETMYMPKNYMRT